MKYEESLTLIEEKRESHPRQSQPSRTLVGVICVVGLIAGSVAAVEMVNQKPVGNVNLDATTSGAKITTQAHLEANGLGTILGNGWCDVRAFTTCIGASDTSACQKEVYASCNPTASTDTSGSGKDQTSPESSAEPNEQQDASGSSDNQTPIGSNANNDTEQSGQQDDSNENDVTKAPKKKKHHHHHHPNTSQPH